MANHSHSRAGSGPTPVLVRRAIGVVLLAFLASLAFGVVALWPGRSAPLEPAVDFSIDRARGTVVSVESCPRDLTVVTICPTGTVDLSSGTEEQVSVVLPSGESAPSVAVGDRLVLAYDASLPTGQQYQFVDFDRRIPIFSIVLVFALVVVALARWRGVASLLSLCVSLGVFFGFLLPGLLSGGSPIALALVGSGVIMMSTLYLGHGFTTQTSVALLGTLISLSVTATLGYVATATSHFTGQADDYSITLGALVGSIDVRGLILAGLVIGALGVLDDVTITQTAVVWELHASDPDASRKMLFSAAMRVGRSHVQATVNTLVLAYLGAALPLFAVFSLARVSLMDTLTSEVVAQEVVSGLVGSMGIVGAVPVTTIIAAAAVTIARPTGPKHSV